MITWQPREPNPPKAPRSPPSKRLTSPENMARPKGVRPHSPAPGQRQRKEELDHSITAKTPARTALRAGDFRIAQSAPCRAPVTFPFVFFSLPPCTAHSLFFLRQEKRGPRKIKDFVGRGGRNGAERSPRRQAGTKWAEFLPTTWGVQSTSYLHS